MVNDKEIDKLLQKAIELTEKEKYEEAIKCFDKALEKNPKNSKAMYWKAFLLYHDMHKIEESLKMCDRCLKEGVMVNYDYTADLLILKAEIYRTLSNSEEALLLAKKALDIISKDNTEYATMQKSYIVYGMIPDLKKMIKKN